LAIDVFKSDKNQVNLLSNARDVISLWIDDKKGHSVTDQKISKDFATYWEADYFKDMDALNVFKVLN
jgi:cysteinyl-tRNA synthetase